MSEKHFFYGSGNVPVGGIGVLDAASFVLTMPRFNQYLLSYFSCAHYYYRTASGAYYNISRGVVHIFFNPAISQSLIPPAAPGKFFFTDVLNAVSFPDIPLQAGPNNSLSFQCEISGGTIAMLTGQTPAGADQVYFDFVVGFTIPKQLS